MKTLLKWVVRLGLGLVLLLVAIFLVAAVMPAAADTVPNPADYGAGAKSVQPSYSGLQREFPATNEPAVNPTTDDKALLGRLLFFDPVLSQNNDIACASCHNPGLGFSDGKAVATGPDGTPLTRNTPSLWNVAYAQNLFWDGRLDSLETQVEFPLTHPNEMGVDDTAALVAELAAIPEYEQLFEAVYDDTVTLDNIEKSLAAFQRTLISNNSSFDQYAAGNFEALTAQQRRGLALFRSGATRCFECHAAPTFASGVVEMPDIATDSAAANGVEAISYRSRIPLKAYEEAGIGPEDVSLAEVYDLSTALELDWIEDLQLVPRGEAAAWLRRGDTALGGRIPVNVSGGLACFGEAVPAQALAQVCELTWQLRGEAGDRQVKGAKVGITANQGLFGHGSSVIVKK